MAQDVATVTSEIEQAESTISEWKKSAAELAGMEDVAGMKELQQEIDDGIANEEARLIRLRDQLAKLQDTLPQPEKPKWSKENHPAFRKAFEAPAEDKPVVHATGDVVEARWTDGLWYKAKISMVLGSTANPQYTVRFVDYQDSSLTVDRSQIRPVISESKKRKIDGASAPQSNASVKTPGVISAAAQVDPEAARNAKKSTAKTTLDDDMEKPKKKSRKIANNKALESSKAKWQTWVNKGPKTAVKKDSMFRTGSAPGARVGFTGSGAGMTKDANRTRNVYRPDLEDDDE